MWIENFNDITMPAWSGRQKNAVVFTENYNRLYRAIIPRGEHFGSDMRRKLGGTRQATISYRIRRSPNYESDATFTGKALGIGDVRWNTGYGHKNPALYGGHGFSARAWVGKDNRFGIYVYHLDQTTKNGKTWGDTFVMGNLSADGEWSDVSISVDLDAGEVWGSINGVESRRWKIRVSSKTRCDIAWLDVYHGGSQVPRRDIWMDFDDIRAEWDTDLIVVPTDGTIPTVAYRDGYDSKPALRWAVKNAQALLANRGFLASNTFNSKCQPDGWFGPGTELAVKAFQRINGLPITAQVDSATWDRLLKRA